MDTLKKYINMCEKAVKIQEEWFVDIGDYILNRNEGILIVSNYHIKKTIDINESYIDVGGVKFGPDNCEIYHQLKRDLIWLPRQDQLQRLLPDKYSTPWALFQHLQLWFEIMSREKIYYAIDFTSVEQYLFAFVMSEKYKKVWNREDWINEKL